MLKDNSSWAWGPSPQVSFPGRPLPFNLWPGRRVVPFSPLNIDIPVRLLSIIPLLGLAACSVPEPQSVEDAPLPPEVVFFNSPAKAAQPPPYSEVVKVNELLFLSGQLGYQTDTRELAEGGIQAETRQVLLNIQETLQHHGADLGDVVKVTVFMADIDEWSAMNEVYQTFFDDHYPARSAVGGLQLARGARLEVECVAVLR